MISEANPKEKPISFPRTIEPGGFDNDGTFIFLAKPTLEELPVLEKMTKEKMSASITGLEVVKSVYKYNPDSLWAIYRSPSERRENPELVGYYAFLLLNEEGAAQLLDRTFDAQSPDFRLLVPEGGQPAASYLWAVIAPRLSWLTNPLMYYAFGDERYADVPWYGLVTSKSGAKSLTRRHHSEGTSLLPMNSIFRVDFTPEDRKRFAAIKVYARGETREEPRPSKPVVIRPRLETRVVASHEELAQVFVIRSAVFVAEQNCPYAEEFDGNDYSCTHVLGYVDGEPAAVMRIRYFASFVKLERLAVLARFRRSLIAKAIVEHAVEICRRKGFRTVYGLSQKRFVGFWEHLGFRALQKNRPVVFSDHEYVEMTGDIEPHGDPITLDSDPMVIVRPEGRWDVPGVLDRSRVRPATNPRRGEGLG